jgi:hypothetical protein
VLAHCRTVLWVVGAPHLSDWFGTQGSSLVFVIAQFVFLGHRLWDSEQTGVTGTFPTQCHLDGEVLSV